MKFNKILTKKDITDTIIAGDCNQDVGEKAVRKFYTEIGVHDARSKVNNALCKHLDKTCEHGLKSIDLIAVVCGIIFYAEGCKLTNCNEIVETDHRGHTINTLMG